MVLIAFSAYRPGIELRRWMWDQTQGAHMEHTLSNAIEWGHAANKYHMLNVYENLVAEDGEDGDEGKFRGTADMHGTMPLDYPPLRLYIMARWEAWTQKEFPTDDRSPRRSDRPHWRPQYEFTRPMLEFNTWCELSAAAVMFLLVYYWLRHCRDLLPWPWPEPIQGAWPALFSALLVWFNPASIFNSDGYVQWDTWLLAPFLLAMLLMLWNQWLIAGICIGVISMCKGQVLLVLPALVAWQLFTLRRSAIPILILCVTGVAGLWVSAHQSFGLSAIYWTVTLVIQATLLLYWFPRSRRHLLLNIAAAAITTAGLILAWRYQPPDLMFAVLAAPVLILWLAQTKHAGAVPRLLIGIALAITCIASPWLLNKDSAVQWVECVLVALMLLQALFWFRQSSRVSITIQIAAVLLSTWLVLWPWLTAEHPDFNYLAWTFVLLQVFAVAARFLPRRFAPAWYCAAACCAVAACVPLFNTSMAWYDVGIRASTNQHKVLEWCDAANLGAILSTYQWNFTSTIDLADYLTFLHKPDVIPVRYLMIAAYLICVTLCGFGMAMHHRRRSPRLFFAMVAPWVLLFALLPQMQGRYLMWGAVFSAATAAFSVEGLLLCLLMSFFNVADTAVWMFHMTRQDVPFVEKWAPLFQPLFPGGSWGIMVVAGIWVYLAVRPAPGKPNVEHLTVNA